MLNRKTSIGALPVCSTCHQILKNYKFTSQCGSDSIFKGCCTFLEIGVEYSFLADHA